MRLGTDLIKAEGGKPGGGRAVHVKGAMRVNLGEGQSIAKHSFLLITLLLAVPYLQAEVNSSGKTIAESDGNHSFSLNESQDDLPTAFQGATAGTSVWLLSFNTHPHTTQIT